MDKYDLVLELIEHPENYSPEQIEALLSDPETRRLYNLLCLADSSVNAACDAPDVEAEWRRFERRQTRRSRNWLGSRAASIAVVVCTTLAALAGIGYGVKLVIKVPETPKAESQTSEPVVVAVCDTIAPFVRPEAPTVAGPTVFEDARLDEILGEVARAYGVDVVYANDEARDLHLYFKLDPSLPLTDVIEQLNTFDRIDIAVDDKTVTVR